MNTPKVLTATLLCDRKSSSQTTAPPALYNLSYPNNTIYFNVESFDFDKNFSELKELIETNGKDVLVDNWQWTASNWWKTPQFDQDQARLVPICMARNMAIDCALLGNFDYIFFVDADVIPPKDSIQRLMAHDRPIVSGLVPGRGAHNHVHYVFHPRGEPKRGIINTAHCTCGFTLIKREVFEVLRFRQGPHPIHRETHLSEDPAYGADIEILLKDVKGGCDGWWCDTTLMAAHMDDPANPLTEKTASQF